MSLSIDTYPKLLSPAKNPVVFVFSSNNSIATAGVIASLELVFNASPFHLINNESFDLILGSNTITITAKTVPDDSGKQIKVLIGGQSIIDWCTQTKNYLNKNYLINRDYIVTSSLNVITLTARVSGTQYNATLDNEPATKMAAGTIVTGVDEVAQEFFSILAQTLVAGLKKFEDSLSLNDSYEAIHDVSEILKAELYSEFEFPEVSSTSWKKRDNICKSFYVNVCEQYGNPLEQQALRNTPTYYAFNGSVPFWKQVEFYSDNSSYWDYLLANHTFSTWQPRTKKIDSTQTEKLYWLAWSAHLNNTICRLKFTLHYYSGGSLTSTVIYSGEQAVTFMEVFELEVGYARLNALYNFDNYFTGASGEYYDIEVARKAGNIVVSEKFTYQIDNTEYPYPKYFLFANSLGGFDTFRATGINEKTDDYERSFITQAYPAEFNAAFKQKKPVNITGSEKYKCNSGWITREQIDWLQDFLLSEEVYETIDGVLYSVNIISTSVRKYADGESPAYQFEFEYERSEHAYAYAAGSGGTNGGDFNSTDFDSNDFNTI